MNDNRIILAEFCDDIRLELGNKYSMMGCYTDELLFESLPSLLPKFCATVTAITLIGNPFQKLVFRAFLNDNLLLENEIPESDLIMNQKMLQEKAGEDNKRIILRIQLAFFTLPIEKESILRIEAETEEGVINGSQIKFGKLSKDSVVEANLK